MNQIASSPTQLELRIDVRSKTAFAEGRHAFFASEPFKDLCSDPDDSLIHSRAMSLLNSYGPVNWSLVEDQVVHFPDESVRLAVLNIITELRQR